MISRIVEWYRIVNMQPTADTIDRRKAAAKDVVAAYESDSGDGLLTVVAGAICGFQPEQVGDPSVQRLIEIIRGKDSAFPQDLSDNALELRAAAATAIGEIVAGESEKAPSARAIMLALVLESGLGFRPTPREHHIANVLSELRTVARDTLSRSQEVRRRRVGAAAAKLLGFDENVTDPLAAVKTFVKSVKSALKELAQQSSIDREEIEVLWWLFGNSSTSTGKALSDMSPGHAALLAGVEVADLCLLPPTNNAESFVVRAMESVKDADAKRELHALVQESDSAARAKLADEDTTKRSKSHAVLFPVSWLCSRLVESRGVGGWTQEFEAKTQLAAKQSLSAVDFGRQIFRERVAQRQFASFSGD